MKPALHQLCQLAHLKLRDLGDRRAQDVDPAGSCEIQYDIAVNPAHTLGSSQWSAMLVQLIKPYVQASEWLLVDHHHAHAAMAWLDSPFYRQKGYSSLIFSYDGGGSDGNLRLFLGKSGDHNLKALGPGQAWLPPWLGIWHGAHPMAPSHPARMARRLRVKWPWRGRSWPLPPLAMCAKSGGPGHNSTSAEVHARDGGWGRGRGGLCWMVFKSGDSFFDSLILQSLWLCDT